MAEAARSGEQAHREQDMRGDHGADHASRAARGADALEIERHEKRFRGKAGETDIERVGEARRAGGVLLRRGENALDPAPQLIAQFCFAFLFVRQISQNFLRRRRHPDDRRNILGSRPAFAFVGSAELDAIDRQTRAEIKKAGAFRSVKFVRAESWRRRLAIRSQSLARQVSQTTAPCRCAGARRASGSAPKFPPSAGSRRFRYSRVMIETSVVSGRIARSSSSGSIKPSGETSSQVTSKPSRFSRCSSVCRTA